MQDDSAAFEGWALALYAHLSGPKKTIITLKAPIPESLPSDIALGHYHRFLYRALKFSEQFHLWFRLAPELNSAVARLKAEFGSGKFVNNFPDGEVRESGARFFSGGKSAIDLWTESGDTISIFELKAQNEMIGMVTELYFYANYIYNMFCRAAIPVSFHPRARCSIAVTVCYLV